MGQETNERLFLGLEGVRGQSRDANHTRWTDVNSFEIQGGVQGATNTIAYSDMHVDAAFDVAAPSILESLWNRNKIDVGEVERTDLFGNRGQLPIEEWIFNGAVATMFQRERNDRVGYSFAFDDGEVCDTTRNNAGATTSRRCAEFVGMGRTEVEEEEDEAVFVDPDSAVFLRVGAIAGESSDPNHRNWIDANAITFSAARLRDDDNALGELELSDFSVFASYDVATLPIIDSMVSGDRNREVRVERTEPFGDAGQLLIERWILRDATVTEVVRSADGVRYSFGFEEFEFCMNERNENGSVRFSQCTDLIVPAEDAVALQAGDSDQDLDFDQLDLVKVQVAAKYLTGQPATWGDGDWNGAPGGSVNSPPDGDGVFNQFDVIAAQQAGAYLTGPYAAVHEDGTRNDGQTSIVYNAASGEISVDAPSGLELTSINVDSAAGIFTGAPAASLGGSFDNDSNTNIFKATFGGSFGSVSFGQVAQAGLSEQFLLGDLSVVGSLAGGGDLGTVDLVYVPEPGSVTAFVLGTLIGLAARRRRLSVDPTTASPNTQLVASIAATPELA